MARKPSVPEKFKSKIERVKFGTEAVRLPEHNIHDLSAESPEMDSVLNFDPLQSAHDLLKSGAVPDSVSVSALGFELLQANSQHREKLLREQGDSIRNDTPERFLKITENLGFEQVMHEPIEHDDHTDDFYVYARRDGLVLVLTTHTIVDQHMNSANLYFQMKRNDPNVFMHTISSSGGFHVRDGLDVMTADESELIWHGNTDVLEAFARKLKILTENGSFLSEWVHNKDSMGTDVWLQHYGDHDGSTPRDYAEQEKITLERKLKLPEWVSNIIGNAPSMLEYAQKPK